MGFDSFFGRPVGITMGLLHVAIALYEHLSLKLMIRNGENSAFEHRLS
jgi:hypothetical protein